MMKIINPLRMVFRTSVIAAALLAAMSPLSVFAASWPASNGVSIGDALMSADPLFEPSGVVWMAARGTYIVVSDEGQIAEMTPSGSIVQRWSVGNAYDLEDVTVIDSSSSFIYLGDENNSSAREFNLSTGTLTGRSWSFASKLSEVDGTTGMEGLTFVPDGSHPFGTTISGGVFYAGWQYDGDIYVFAPDLTTSGSQTFVEEIHMTSGYTDLAALSYNAKTQRVYALYDGLNILEERDATGAMVASYSVPGSDQEGIAVADAYPAETATVVIAEDSGHIYSYSGYPVSYPSAPVPAPEPTPTPVSPIEIAGDGIDNDGDEIVDEYNTLAENGLHPVYGARTPVSGSGYGTDVLSVSGLVDGDIRVEYADHAVYRYDIFSTRTKTKASVSSLDGSAYLIVILGKQTALVNGDSGAVVATTTTFRRLSQAQAWARSVVGW